MPNPIVPKKSSTPGAVPTSGQLLTGEIAANTADGKLFIKKSDGTVTAVSGSGGTIEYATSSLFPATGQTSVVYVATDVSRAYRWTGSEYVEIGPISTYVLNHSHDASAVTTGTLDANRLPTNVQSAMNLYLWSAFR